VSTLDDRVRRLEDVEAIRALDARYCRLIDTGDWPGLVALFAPDGAFDGLQRADGHDALLAFFGGLAGSGMRWWHHVGNHEIEVAGDTATVRSMLWQPCVVDGVPHVAAGRYSDRLVRTADGWRYQLKQVRFDYWGPLRDGWDQHRFGFSPARAAATPTRSLA
jgi:ketosteroid isomerase-like protein